MRDKLVKFMAGRYGADQLFYMLTGLYLVMVFTNVLFRSWVLHILSLVVFAVTVLRTLSRNVEKRRRENDKAVAFIGKLRAKADRSRRIREQSDEYYFTKCPGCKKTLRLPRVEGSHTAKCPACGESFTVKIKPAKSKGRK